MNIEPFGVEIWMNATETRCELNLAETCIHSLTPRELLALAGADRDPLAGLMDARLTYGAIEGSDRLRRAIAATYSERGPEEVVVTHGTIGANMLVHRALVGTGDAVVCVRPTYQQHHSIPLSLGAEVREVWLREDEGWALDLEAVARAAKGARLIALTNPNNPTGAVLRANALRALVRIAEAEGAWLLADEVYRGLEEGEPVPSVADLSQRGISTCGMSKSYGLAGLRLGWVAGPREVIDRVMIHRDYDTISVGMIDDHLSALALEARDAVLARSRELIARNRKVVGDWIAGEDALRWTGPGEGTTMLLAYDGAEPSEAFCRALLAETGVLLTPGSALGMEGYVRLGAGCDTDVLREGLARLSGFLAVRRRGSPPAR